LFVDCLLETDIIFRGAMKLSIKTLNSTLFSILTQSIRALSITTLCLITLSIMTQTA
jgi:hypothetical protein